MMSLFEYLKLAEWAFFDSGECQLPEREKVELEKGAGRDWTGEAKAVLTGNLHHPVRVMFFYDHDIYFIMLNRVRKFCVDRYRWEPDIDWDRNPTVVDKYLMANLACKESIAYIPNEEVQK